MSSFTVLPSASITTKNETSIMEAQSIPDKMEKTSVSPGSTIEDDDTSDPHQPIWQDGIFLNLDTGEGFELDVTTVLMSNPSLCIEELRLFIHPDSCSEANIYHDSKLERNIESILTKYSAISRLYIHIGYHRGEGLSGFQQDAMYSALAKGSLTQVTSLVLPLFKKHQVSLRTLSLGGYQLLDGGLGTHPGSEITLSEISDIAAFEDALVQIETLDVGIHLPTSGSAADQEIQAATQAKALGRLIQKLPILKDLSIRWDQPYHVDWSRYGRRLKIPEDLQLKFCSWILLNLESTRELQRLFLRGFSRISRDVMHSILCQNQQLEKIEIAVWYPDHLNFYSEVHHITCSSTTWKVDKTPFYHKIVGEKGERATVTRWQPDGYVTESKMRAEMTEVGDSLGGDVASPVSRSEGVRRVLSLLETSKLVQFHDNVDFIAEKAIVHGVAIRGSTSIPRDADAKTPASGCKRTGKMHAQERKATRRLESSSQHGYARDSQHHVLEGGIRKKTGKSRR